MWLLCVADACQRASHAFYPVGLYSSREKALGALKGFPPEKHYQLFETPVDEFLGYIDQHGQLQSGLGRLGHEHFVPEDPNEV